MHPENQFGITLSILLQHHLRNNSDRQTNVSNLVMSPTTECGQVHFNFLTVLLILLNFTRTIKRIMFRQTFSQAACLCLSHPDVLRHVEIFLLAFTSTTFTNSFIDLCWLF